jgi:hypothetical protein
MSKYDSLARRLAEIEGDTVTMSFSEVADLLTGGLPQSAYDYRPWWANRHDGNDAQNKGWQSVGWETADVDMKRQRVTFNRMVKVRSDFLEVPFVRPLTIEEAKRGLALKFAISPDQIEISIRG